MFVLLKLYREPVFLLTISDMSVCPLHSGGTFGPVDDGQKPSISRLIKNFSMGLLKKGK